MSILTVISPVSAQVVTGGTITTVTDGGVVYRVHTFTEDGNFTIAPGNNLDIEYLIVGGGGAGGASRTNSAVTGGGGGAGGIINSTASLVPGTYSIIVGNGGASALTNSNSINSGSNSSAFGHIAGGGGGGAPRVDISNPVLGVLPPADGGSGGGALGGGTNSSGGSANGLGTGNNGGNGQTSFPYSGGGGGAAGPGKDASSGGGGGPGLMWLDGNIYAVGGSGGNASGTPLNGEPNTGNGGQGGTRAMSSGSGGSGIVVVRYAMDSTAPTVLILNAPSHHDRSSPFNVMFKFSESVTGFVQGDITVGYGTMSNFVTVDGSTYTAKIIPSGPQDVTLDVAASVAQDSAGNANTAAPQLVVAGTVFSQTQELISNFMVSRAKQILINQPNFTSFITGTNNFDTGPLGTLQFETDFATETEFYFFTSHSKIRAQEHNTKLAAHHAASKQDIDEGLESEERSTVVPGYGYKLRQNKTGEWDVWLEVKGSQSMIDDLKSKFWSAQLGSHYFYKTDHLIGMMAQFDWAKAVNIPNLTNQSAISGNGYMIGPYFAGKIEDQPLYYQIHALWGQSLNNISPLGTYLDEFSSQRWLLNAELHGFFALDEQTVIKPELAFSFFEETQKSYSDGQSNTIPEQTISFGELSFGPGIERKFEFDNGFSLGASIGASGVFTFAQDEGYVSSASGYTSEDFRARVQANLQLQNKQGLSIKASAYYDGIGVDNYETFGGSLNLTIPLQ